MNDLVLKSWARLFLGVSAGRDGFLGGTLSDDGYDSRHVVMDNWDDLFGEVVRRIFFIFLCHGIFSEA
jgi:hypothetical protein